MRTVHWVSKSSDKKIGEVLASYSPIETCPDSCSLKTGGCYAWGLFYLRTLGRKISSGTLKAKTLTEALKGRSSTAKIVRHRVAGDVVGDVKMTLKECAEASAAGLINIGYTHTWRDKESQALKDLFRASCNDMDDLKEAHSKGWAATIVVDGNVPKSTFLNGKKAVICPARHGVPGKKDISCNDCTLCRVDSKTKDITVMFKVHGNASTINGSKDKVMIFK